ncbi:MAG TPA: 50S ribosomal protein L4 [Bacteroidales bacterium]|nr:50S ribosomal protein L4 [Bacteroidales bacterium]HNQ83166.1 50S ribosomal protein L4 [Bacteroidales bacterium]HOX76472.1 50S ribosomal protein L4 [Bacteroidales bacterium]HPI85279.1 50S ribosomal protein L4 [Bacteroidales bacterium]
MELDVYNISGGKTSKKVTLNEGIFGITPNDHAIWLDVKLYLANQRQGTSKAKERSEVSGSTRKLKRQKGTGTARSGDINSPVFRGGGRAFGPRPRDYEFKLNKKLRKLARKSALTYKAQENGIVILEDFNFEEAKTKNFVAMLKNLNLEDKKTLLVMPDTDKNLVLSSRNLKKAKVMRAEMLNTYDILNANNVVIAESSMPIIEEILG